MSAITPIGDKTWRVRFVREVPKADVYFIALENVRALTPLTSNQPPMPPDHAQFPGADTILPVLCNCGPLRAGKR